MNFPKLELTLEQEFHLKTLQDSLGKLTKEQAGNLLIEATRLIMVKDNVIKQLLKAAP